MTNIPIPDGDGVWTMTDAEFKRELAKAWDEGFDWGKAGEYTRLEEYDANPHRSQA